MELFLSTIVDELQSAVRQRGEMSRAQIEFARAEFQAMKEMYPIAKPSEEVRTSYNRTLQRYLGEHAVSMMRENRKS
ncbi:MAG: hypothetical protein AMK70_04055 [Nitrospira bacterium SG8_35_1]|nr:MAG: hypothetical protein AMK70_04055 [Nitrospira bacterium SG8_35_1]